ncbi:MAG: TetR/AcrR family transcriptional regulator [Acidimicrobiales bacterium]|nr:TetR/AcrR family transcriptional regulator [Acidimicrobiales bacterium]HRW38909.1 TetR/AcrR family transcriptional regulator [Aquihabitans sp.]
MAGDREPLQRDGIVEAARQLVIAGGLEALSLRRLASQLGVTAPALYAHVRDKKDLLRAIAEVEFDHLVARFDAVDATDPIDRIRAHGRAYVEHARAQPELFRVMFLFPPEAIPADVPEEARLPGATKAFAAAASAVDEAIASGALEVDDPLLLSLTLWSGVHGVASVLQLGVDLPPELEEAMIDDVTDRIIAGYRPGADRS